VYDIIEKGGMGRMGDTILAEWGPLVVSATISVVLFMVLRDLSLSPKPRSHRLVNIMDVTTLVSVVVAACFVWEAYRGMGMYIADAAFCAWLLVAVFAKWYFIQRPLGAQQEEL